MKKLLLLTLALILVGSKIKAQSNEILDLLNKDNIALSKSTKKIGNLEEKVFFDILTVENMADGKILKGVVISVERKQQVVSNILDSAEIITFVNALKRLQQKLDDPEFRKSTFRLASGSGIIITSNFSTINNLWLHKLDIKRSPLDPVFHFGNSGLNDLLAILFAGKEDLKK